MGLLRIDSDYIASDDNWQRQWDMVHLSDEEQKRLYAMSGELQELEIQMLLQIHDAIGFQIPEKNADRALPMIAPLMSIPIPIKRRGLDPYEIRIPTDIQVGYNWGEYDPKKPDLNPNGLRSWRPLSLASS